MQQAAQTENPLLLSSPWVAAWLALRQHLSVFVGLSMSSSPSQSWPGSERRSGGHSGPINCLDSPQPVWMPPELIPACLGPTSCPSGHPLTWTWGR